MRHALFVAFHFPPEAGSSGVLRTLKYVRYLHEFGWRVTVVAPRVDAYAVTDLELETQLPASCRVVRTGYLSTRRHLSLVGRYPALLALPDVWVGWFPWAVAAGRRVLKADPIDLVYSTSPHATAHLIARSIARRIRRPWVADFRDPWFEEPPEPGAPDGLLFRSLDRRLERSVIESCSAVVASTTGLCELLRKRYPYVFHEKFCAIFNGYDEADFKDMDIEISGHGDRMNIVHAGSLNPKFRDPRPLFRALRRCADTRRIDLARVRLRLVGGGAFAGSEVVRAAINSLGLDDVVQIVPRVPYAQSLHELANSDLLLLIQASTDTVSLVPAKLYEYLRTQRPVLALVHPGATGEVIEMTGGGWMVAPEDEFRLADVLSEAYRGWRANTLRDVVADLNVLRRFDRKALTGELANLFDRLLQP
jgi:glycosyltransferase involved in cell wall biosynthesis